MPTLATSRSWLAGLLLLFALLALPAQRARAQEGDFGGSYQLQISPELYVVMLTTLVGGFSGAVFLVVDIVHGEWLPPLPAALELVLAGLPLLTGGIVALVSFDSAGLGPPLTIFGACFSAHAVASLVLYQSAPAPGAAARQRARNLSIAPVLAPNLIGGALTAQL